MLQIIVEIMIFKTFCMYLAQAVKTLQYPAIGNQIVVKFANCLGSGHDAAA